MPKKRTILLVEDNADARETLRGLMKEKYEIYEAANGEEALKILQKSASDISLIILDIRMPIMDGVTFLKKMNEKKYRNKVIMLTAYDEADNWLDTILSHLQVIGFVVKPYVSQELLETIDLFFEGKEKIIRDTAIAKFEKKMWPGEKDNKVVIENLKKWAANVDLEKSRTKTDPHSDYLKFI